MSIELTIGGVDYQTEYIEPYHDKHGRALDKCCSALARGDWIRAAKYAYELARMERDATDEDVADAHEYGAQVRVIRSDDELAGRVVEIIYSLRPLDEEREYGVVHFTDPRTGRLNAKYVKRPVYREVLRYERRDHPR